MKTSTRITGSMFLAILMPLFSGCQIESHSPLPPSVVEGIAIEEAIAKGDLVSLTELQKNGADMSNAPKVYNTNPVFVTYTPLSHALRYKQRRIAEYLLSQPISINATNSDGTTALFWSIDSDTFGSEMTKAVLAKGADPNVKDRDGETPLNSARRGQLPAITKLLLEGGARDRFVEGVVLAPQVRFETNGSKKLLFGGAHGGEATNALVVASGDGNLPLVKKLLDAGADVNSRDKVYLWASTPLDIAVLRNHLEVASYLIQHGADINAQNFFGNTPLMLAAGNPEGTVEMVKLLLSKSANPKLTDKEGATALDYASLGSNTNIAELIRESVEKLH